MKRGTCLTMLLAFCAGTAHADYQVTGRFEYQDRAFSVNGFTGNDPELPIRFADVEVVQVLDGGSTTLLASGSTDANGFFTLQVAETTTRNVMVRVVSTSTQHGLPIRVLETPSGMPVAVTTSVFTDHPPNQNIDFSSQPILAQQFQGGEYFNIFDQAVVAMDFIKAMDGEHPTPSQSLTLYWRNGNSFGTFFNSGQRAVYLLGEPSDSDGYDDSVILHEIGHYMEFVLADSDNNGGPHQLNGCYEPELTWSEGFGTAFQNIVRAWQGLDRPDIYVDTTGQPGPGRVRISYEVETPSTGRLGHGNEVAVNAALWDVVDDATTLDASPGVDDDPMQVAGAVANVWDVLVNYLPRPGVANISAEDFWEGWFALAHNEAAGMSAVFAAQGMRFAEDAYEPDDSAGEARDGATSTQTTEHSISGDGDEDWTRFDGIGGSTYVFRTAGLPCGSNTRLDLYDSNATTLLASHVSVNPPSDMSSRIEYTATKNGDLFLRVTRPNDGHHYTTYDLVVDIQVPVLVSNVELTGTPQGVQLDWQAASEAGFTHFDVQRGAQEVGPWTRINAAPVVSVPGDSNAFTYLDDEVDAEQRWFYRLVGVDEGGQETFFGPYQTAVPPPSRVALHAPHPNPFNPYTTLSFDLPRDAPVSLRIYNAGGRLVRTLLRGAARQAGTRLEERWDGTDDDGRAVASGVYVVLLDALGSKQTRRAVVIR